MTIASGPPQVRRDDVQRRVVIQANVQGRDMGSVVADIRQSIDEQLALPTGYSVDIGGQFENQQRAQKRLSLVVPLSLGLIALLLYFAFASFGQAMLILVNVPLAVIGGVFSLWLSGQYLSVPSSVGFITLFGVAVLNGVVMVESINQRVADGLSVSDAVFDGATSRPTGSAAGKAELNIDVAYGRKARIALNSGQWRIAADAAAMARQNYPLMSEGDWKSGFNTTLLPEVIWGSNVIDTETTFFRSYFYLMCNTFNGSQNRNNPKIADRRLVDAIPDTDYRKDVFLINAPNTNTSAANGEGGWANNTNPLYTTEAEFDAAEAFYRDLYGWTSRHNAHPYMHVKMLQKNPGTIDPDDIIYMRS